MARNSSNEKVWSRKTSFMSIPLSEKSIHVQLVFFRQRYATGFEHRFSRYLHPDSVVSPDRLRKVGLALSLSRYLHPDSVVSPDSGQWHRGSRCRQGHHFVPRATDSHRDLPLKGARHSSSAAGSRRASALEGS